MSANITIETGQLPLFDPEGGRKRKGMGLRRATAGKQQVLSFIRRKLENLYIDRYRYQDEPFVTADDARQFLSEYYNGQPVPKGGNSFLGSVFRDGNWARTGRYVPSLVKSNNARMIPCWRVRGPGE